MLEMDSMKLVGKLGAFGPLLKKAGKVLGVLALVVLGIKFGPYLAGKSKVLLDTQTGRQVAGVVKTYGHAVESVQEKMDALSRSEQENEKLRLENANLRMQAENAVFDCRAKDSSTRTRELEFKLSKETGAQVGRTLASIYYRPPTHLMPPQLYTLGVSYFKGREYEKSAVIFTFLTGLEDNNAYKSAKNYLLTGVAWYRLDNFEIADAYFEKVLRMQDGAENLAYHAQARLWRGLAAEKTGNHQKSQEWMRNLVDYHPQSTEAGWINLAKENKRQPAAGAGPKPEKRETPVVMDLEEKTDG
ncbi:MAG: hypothetical protein A2583_10520 [Bdellovibrionales bacterium RIFOXYD1_FULL_53_11]|nr:MAG: hypothetical protein A2583_10520 [Bdellovibrionales bacterium RIFOXYD1_FULL_53_11]